MVRPAGDANTERAWGKRDAEERVRPRNISKGAWRQRRYRQRKRNATASLVARVTRALEALVDAIEGVTPEQVAESLNDVTALGIGGDAQLASSWLSTLEVLAARRAGR
jgi:hypothetical protein